jgi:hypothetical protein
MRLLQTLLLTVLAALAFLASGARAGEPNDMFMIRSTDKSYGQVTDAAKAYVSKQGWVYVNEAELKGVVMIKFCVPEMAKDIFAAGDFVTAMLPCGQIGLYKKDGKTQIAMLHPGYMERIYPDPNIRRAAEKGLPLFQAMLEEIAR